MITLAFPPEEAARIVNGEQTVVTYGSLAIPPSTERWRRPSDLVGQTVAIARLPVKPAEERDEDTATAWQHLARWHGTGNPNDLLPDQRAWLEAVTSEGAIVGSARVADVVQIVDMADSTRPESGYIATDGHTAVYVSADRHTAYFVIDQLPFADFTPGRWAVILTDAARCEKRCPACDWHDYHPDIHRADGNCDPIPYTQDGPIGEWTP